MRQQAIDEICKHFNIGNYISHTKVDRGGSHYLWHLYTTSGQYALKQILSDETHFELDETIATAFKTNGIPAVSAILGANGKYMHYVDSIKALVHPWIDGEIIYDGDADNNHINAIGQVLAGMCNLNLRMDSFLLPTASHITEKPQDDISVGQEKIRLAVQEAIDCNAPFAKALKSRLDYLVSLYANEKTAEFDLKEGAILCHNDLNNGNIIWVGHTLQLIDWEGMKPTNPNVALMKAAYMWSMNNLKALPVLIDSYIKAGGNFNVDYAYKAFSMLEGDELRWMMKNVKRYCDINTPYEDKIQCEQTVNDVLNNLAEVMPKMKEAFEQYLQSR